MANYSLVIDSAFKPFSYQEMLAPVMMATQAHQDLENQYGELEAKASLWEKLANEQPDSKAYTMYKTYANDLREQADQLAREGLNATSRRSALNMKSRYSKEIVPIEQAYDARAKQAYQQQQARLQDPTLIFNRKAESTSLDKYLENPQLGYESYSGALLAEQVGKAASAIAKQILDNPTEWEGILGDSYYRIATQKGIPSDILANYLYYADDIAYNDLDPESVGIPSKIADILGEALAGPLASSGIRNWKKNMSEAEWKELVPVVNNYARQGLWNAVGQEEAQVVQNWRKQQQLSQQFQAAEAAANRKHQKDMADEARKPREIIGADGKSTGTYYDPTLGLITDKDGKKIIVGADRNPIKLNNKDKNSTEKTVTGATLEDFKKVAKTSDMIKLGYTPVRAVAKLDGNWRIGANGDDAQGVLFGGTRSKVISDFGNYDISYKKGSYVNPGDNGNYDGVPQDVKDLIADYSSTLLSHQDVQLMRVHSRGDGSSGDDYDYIILISN